ncbi:MAG: sulfatase-like hydrolase/transferase [Paracoccaceae bacterium]
MSSAKNVLLISLDDCFSYWKYRSAFGAPLQTPNLDRICEKATVFNNAYCQVPVCGPSRSSFMSGLTPHQTGVFDNYTSIFDVVRPEQMWPYRLKEAGYYCSNGGKVHHGYRPLPEDLHHTFYSHPPQDMGHNPGKKVSKIDFGGMNRGWGTTNTKHDKKYYDASVSTAGAAFFKNYDGTAPFYREVGFRHPHSPFPTPVRFKEMYDEDAFIQPEDWAGGWDKNPYADMFMRENIDSSSLAFWRKSVRNYFSAISHVDYHIGKVWDALQASPHADNTLVAIVADHGYHPGDKNRFRKYTLWEEAAGVPMVIYDPETKRGQVVDDPVALLDIGPTILDYTGCAPLSGTPGVSLKPQAEGAKVTGRAVPTFFFGSASIRRGDWRYIRYQDGSSQLYNIADDLWQLRDLSADSDMADTMHACLLETCRDYGLTISDPNAPAGSDVCDYTSVPKDQTEPDRLPAHGLITVDSPGPHAPDPGNRKLFATLNTDTDLALGPGIRSAYCASDFKFEIERFGIIGNDLGNTVNFISGHNRFTLDIDCGFGDDKIVTTQDGLNVRLVAGRNQMWVGEGGGTIVGGTGHDTIRANLGHVEIFGGSGNTSLLTENAELTVFTGDGRNHVICGSKPARVIVTGGTNRIDVRDGTLDLVVQRTGLAQTVTGFKRGQIELPDWGELEIETSGNDTCLTWASEIVTFANTPRDVVEQALNA